MTPHVQYSFIAAELLAAAPSWSPAYFTGAAPIAMRAGLSGRLIRELGGRILEGWRASETLGVLAYDARAATTPVYRQANIGRLRLHLGSQHWASPSITGRWCVQPGDVVVNKLSPIRAAFVSPNAKRHPADGNLLIIRGLPRAEAVWVAFCLNQPSYKELLLIKSGVLQRVGLGALASVRVPPTPPQMDGLSARLRDSLDSQTTSTEGLFRAHAEVNEATSVAPKQAHDLRTGEFFKCEAVTNDSWLPSATALRAEQTALKAELGWASISDLASFSGRTRLSQVPEGAQALRLRDVGDELFVASDDAGGLIPSRTLANPLFPGEVLLSTLGTSFRAAYVDEHVPKNTFPVDGWARLRFRETPAAWALLLSTNAIRSQAARLAVGSAQQFVPPDALRSLRVPLPPREVRDRWQREVDRHHAKRREQDREWSAISHELSTLFEAVHRPSAMARSRAKEVVQ